MPDLLPYKVSPTLLPKLSNLPPSTRPKSTEKQPQSGQSSQPPRLLLTSFRPWRAHQVSNAADDLLVWLQQQALLPDNTVLLRQLPVSFQLAPAEVIAKIVWFQPRCVICCGMAENRHQLSLERQGICNNQPLQTSLHLPTLLQGTGLTEISEDAGTYVCNHLYFQVLQFLKQKSVNCQALFVHVPPLNQANLLTIAQDFCQILRQLSTQLDQFHEALSTSTHSRSRRTTRSHSA
ncbi:pyroglutamyl-peptidase I family protein [Almyronema epifaneia]|uniref:Peptidase C15 n=1 Tax=Almyronema epifaneia S1 TaxID=2991925 RepID=A0ABW6IBZ7_9CYAN